MSKPDKKILTINETLKPCPFCGVEARLLEGKTDFGLQAFRVSCSNHNCSVSAYTVDFTSEKAAIAAWNKRAKNTGGNKI